MLTIHDEQLVRQLKAIAARENRPVEDLIRALVADYAPVERSAPAPRAATEDGVRQVRQKIYAEARRYWQQAGDHDRLALTDADLDAQFWLIDPEGIPRLKTDQERIDLPPGTTAYAAASIDDIAFDTEDPIDAEDVRDILTNEYSEHLYRRFNDGTPKNTD
jgi:plasmid stability protein